MPSPPPPLPPAGARQEARGATRSARRGEARGGARLVRQRARARDDPDLSLLVDVAGHDANLARAAGGVFRVDDACAARVAGVGGGGGGARRLPRARWRPGSWARSAASSSGSSALFLPAQKGRDEARWGRSGKERGDAAAERGTLNHVMTRGCLGCVSDVSRRLLGGVSRVTRRCLGMSRRCLGGVSEGLERRDALHLDHVMLRHALRDADYQRDLGLDGLHDGALRTGRRHLPWGGRGGGRGGGQQERGVGGSGGRGEGVVRGGAARRGKGGGVERTKRTAASQSVSFLASPIVV